MNKLLTLMAEKNASDLFLSPNAVAQFRIEGTSYFVNQQPLSAQEVTILIRELAGAVRWAQFAREVERENDLNFSYALPDVGSFRVSVFRQRGTPAAVIRYIPREIPSLATLGLPPSLGKIALAPQGLVLVVGPSGSGKSTTLAAMLNYRNEQKTGHILTLENPVEFSLTSQRSIVNQREIGADTASLQIAMRNAIRQSPDCLSIGDISDAETLTNALEFAEAGHLVFATSSARNASLSLSRLLNLCSKEVQPYVLNTLASSLRAVVAMRLIPTLTGGRAPAIELFVNTRQVSDLIAKGSMAEIWKGVEQGLFPGSYSFEQSLLQLIQRGQISQAESVHHSDRPEHLLWLTENKPGAASPTATVHYPSANDHLDAPSSWTPPPVSTNGSATSDVAFSERLMNV